MVGRDGMTQVIGLGIWPAETRMLATVTPGRSKVAYASPEVLRGEPFDCRADLWSCAIMLWELLTGRRMFAQATDYDRIRAILTCRVPLPSEAGAPTTAFDAILRRGTAALPSMRFGTAAEMSAAIVAAGPLARKHHVGMLVERNCASVLATRAALLQATIG
jgi:eukaryotic-like serine/threonine-protein kinase